MCHNYIRQIRPSNAEEFLHNTPQHGGLAGTYPSWFTLPSLPPPPKPRVRPPLCFPPHPPI